MTKEWRCKACDTRLGIQEDEELHLKYKKAGYQVRGKGAVVKATCRNCGTANLGPKL